MLTEPDARGPGVSRRRLLSGQTAAAAAVAGLLLAPSDSRAAAISTSNVYTTTQIFQADGYPIVLEDSSGRTLSQLGNIARTGFQAGAVTVWGTNAPGAPSHGAWAFGVDTAATVPYRDWFLSKVLADGSVSDVDGVYISNGGAPKPAAVGIGYSAPADRGTFARLKVMASGAAGDPTQASVVIPFASGQTGDMLAVGSTKDAYGAFRLRSDGTLIAHAAATPNTTGTTGGTTSGSHTLIDENATFTPDQQGQFIARGAGFPDGTYVAAVVGPTQLTMSSNATTTATGVSYTLLGVQLQFRTAAGAPTITATQPKESGALVLSSPEVGIGPGVSSPGATLDVAAAESGSASLHVRTTSWGSLQINVSGSAPGDSVISTGNATALRFGTAGTTVALAIDETRNVLTGPGAGSMPSELATDAIDGFFYIPTMDGAPTAAPASQPTGTTVLVYNRAGNTLDVYAGGRWRGVALSEAST